MAKILTDAIIPELKDNIMGKVLWEGSFGNEKMGVDNAITLSAPLSNYQKVAFDVGLNNWNGMGRQLIYSNAKESSHIISLVYSATNGASNIRTGVLISTGDTLRWELGRSWERILAGDSTNIYNNLRSATASESGIILYRVIGYKDF